MTTITTTAMGCKGRRIGGRMRYVSDIRTMGELREAQKVLDLRQWYAGQRLSEGTSEVFSPSGLMSIIAPEGSVTNRLVGSVGTGLATMGGLLSAARIFINRRRGGVSGSHSGSGARSGSGAHSGSGARSDSGTHSSYRSGSGARTSSGRTSSN